MFRPPGFGHLVFLLLLSTSAGACASATSAAVPLPLGEVVRVVDGDTVVVRMGSSEEHVRLLGIDTPEIAHHGQTEECFGPEATAWLTELLPPGTVVTLHRDVEARDAYGRLLAHLSVDGTLINHALVAHGYAEVLVIAPNGLLADAFIAAERAARDDLRGRWGACPTP